MTRAAWIMLATTWAVVAAMTARTFLRVLRRSAASEEPRPGTDAERRDRPRGGFRGARDRGVPR